MLNFFRNWRTRRTLAYGWKIHFLMDMTNEPLRSQMLTKLRSGGKLYRYVFVEEMMSRQHTKILCFLWNIDAMTKTILRKHEQH